MGLPKLSSRRELVAQAIRRWITYTDEVTYFAANSVDTAIAEVVAGQASLGVRLYKALVRRQSLATAVGEQLSEVAGEHGADRLDAQRSRVLIVLVPHSTVITAISYGLTILLEVEDASEFAVGDSIRIRTVDGTQTEKLDVIGRTANTGPNGNDELEVAALTGLYTVSGDNLQVLLRQEIPIETVFTSAAGVGFASTASVTVGDANPVLSGESAALSLADKVWAEALVSGAVGNIDPDTITGFETPNTKIKRVYNPERARGGAEAEPDFDLRYRASHVPSVAAQETPAWAEALAQLADRQVLRATTGTPDAVSTLEIRVLARNGGPLSTKQLDALADYIGARVRSYMRVEVRNIDLVSIEVEAQVHLDPNVTLREAWLDAAARIANYVDYSRWPYEVEVDEIELKRLVAAALGIRSVVESTFTPAAPVPIAVGQLPAFVRLSLQDADSLETINADLSATFGDG